GRGQFPRRKQLPPLLDGRRAILFRGQGVVPELPAVRDEPVQVPVRQPADAQPVAVQQVDQCLIRGRLLQLVLPKIVQQLQDRRRLGGGQLALLDQGL